MFGGSAFVSVTTGGNWGEHKTDNMPLFIFHPLDGKESDFALTHPLEVFPSIFSLFKTQVIFNSFNEVRVNSS